MAKIKGKRGNLLGLFLLPSIVVLSWWFTATPVTGQSGPEPFVDSRSSGEFPPMPKMDLATDDASLSRYEGDFAMAAAGMEEACNITPATVYRVFAKHFVPTIVGRNLRCSCKALQRRLVGFRAMGRPSQEEGETEISLYAGQLRIVTAFLKAATSRLYSLTQAAKFASEAAIASSLHAIALTVPSARHLMEQQTDLAPFSSLVTALAKRSGPPPTFREAIGLIPEVLVQKLADSILASDMHIEHDREVADVFSTHLAGVGMMPSRKEQTSNIQSLANAETIPIPNKARPFPLMFFKTVLEGFHQLQDQFLIPADHIDSWAEDWTVQGALRNLYELEDREQFRIDGVLAVKESIVKEWLSTQENPQPGYDLFTLAVFLL